MESQIIDNFDVVTKKIESLYFAGYMTTNIIEQKYAYMQLLGYASCLHDLGLITQYEFAYKHIVELDGFYLAEGRPVAQDIL